MTRSYEDQFRRVIRFYKRICNHNQSSEDYEDFVWGFFQNCWHLKDWIKNDPNLHININRDIFGPPGIESLLICSHLANRSKHYSLDKKHIERNQKNSPGMQNAEVIGKQTNIDISNTISTDNAPERQESVSQQYIYTIICDNSKNWDMLKLAETAVSDWKGLLKKYSLAIPME